MIKFFVVCLVAYLLHKFLKPLVEFAGLIMLLILVSYGVTEFGEDIINYINELYFRLLS